MTTFELRPFAIGEAEMVAHWATGPQDLWQANLSEETGLTAQQVKRWTLETNFAFTLRVDGDLAAYGEIVEDDVEGDAEIQHVLVAPDLRGRGIGAEMLTHLCQFLTEQRPFPEVWVRFARENKAAAECATTAGFVASESMSGPHYLWMKKALQRP